MVRLRVSVFNHALRVHVVLVAMRFLGTDSEENVLHGVHGEAKPEDAQLLLGAVQTVE